jgi:hypothetical protein
MFGQMRKNLFISLSAEKVRAPRSRCRGVKDGVRAAGGDLGPGVKDYVLEGVSGVEFRQLM